MGRFPSACRSTPAGNLSDRIGAKRALGWGIALLLVASVGCALAPTSGVLIAARFLQGGAASIMLPASMALIRRAFPDPRRRAHALGIWAVGGVVAGAVGPHIVSGSLSNRFGTRVPVVVGLSSMVVGLTAMLLTAPLGSPLLVGTFLVFTGSGGSIAMPQVTAVVLASVPSEKAGTASAVFNTFRQVGGAVAIAVFGALIADRTSFVHGMQTSFIIAASLLLLTALASLFIHSPAATKSPENVA